MAKQRNYNNGGRRNSNKGAWRPPYSSEGQMDFTCQGYVQKINEGDGRDFVQFTIDNPFVKGNFNSFTIEVSWEGFPQLELGDHVEIFGLVRSWWNADAEKVDYSFVAEQVKVLEDEVVEEKPKGRRGLVKNDELFGS